MCSCASALVDGLPTIGKRLPSGKCTHHALSCFSHFIGHCLDQWPWVLACWEAMACSGPAVQLDDDYMAANYWVGMPLKPAHDDSPELHLCAPVASGAGIREP